MSVFDNIKLEAATGFEPVNNGFADRLCQDAKLRPDARKPGLTKDTA